MNNTFIFPSAYPSVHPPCLQHQGEDGLPSCAGPYSALIHTTIFLPYRSIHSSSSSPCLLIHHKTLLSTPIDWLVFIIIAFPRYSHQGLALHYHWLHVYSIITLPRYTPPRPCSPLPLIGMSSSSSICLVFHLHGLVFCIIALPRYWAPRSCFSLPPLIGVSSSSSPCLVIHLQGLAFYSHWLACLERHRLALLFTTKALLSTPIDWHVFIIIAFSRYSPPRPCSPLSLLGIVQRHGLASLFAPRPCSPLPLLGMSSALQRHRRVSLFTPRPCSPIPLIGLSSASSPCLFIHH